MRPMPERDASVDPVRDLRRVLAVAVVLVAAVVLVQAGCNTGPEHRIDDGELRLELTEYSISPRNLVMPAGRLVVRARNGGRLVHSLRIVSDDDKRGNRRARFAASVRPPLKPGDARDAFLAVCLGPGDYRIISGQAGEEDLGMVADLHVTGPEPPCTPEPGRRREDPADAAAVSEGG
jgi:hypothetical protein